MKYTPSNLEITAEYADQCVLTVRNQLSVCRNFRQPRLEKIKKMENLALGIPEPAFSNPFNDDFGFAGSFVDNLTSQIDTMPRIRFGYKDLADYKTALYTTAAMEMEMQAKTPNAQWAMKDRWASRLAIFSGRGTHYFHAESDPEYRSVFDVVDHYDLLFEPAGGGLLDNHLFCGNEAVFKTKGELEAGVAAGIYDAEQVGMLIRGTGEDEWKEVQDDFDNRQNRARALGQDMGSHNYVGEPIWKFVQMFTTFRGNRVYLLFEERSGIWIRIKPLDKVYPYGRYPLVSWATHEDPKVFLSKAPMDTAYVIGTNINRFLNQEAYNREKRNNGREFYDADMITDVAAYVSNRPDAKIPVDTKGNKLPSQAVFRSPDGELNGTVEFVSFLDSYGGLKSGSTPGSQGQAEKNKRVSVYFTEIQQVKNRLTPINESKKDAFEAIAMRYDCGLQEHLKGKMAIELMGTRGVEWKDMTRLDLRRNRELKITISAGDEERREDMLKEGKAKILGTLTTVNPKWKDREAMRIAGYTEQQIREAWEGEGADMVLLSEAAQAVKDIIAGREVKKNRGANSAFLFKIYDLAEEYSDIPDETFDKIMAYAESHDEIAASNERRAAGDIIRKNVEAQASMPALNAKRVQADTGKPIESAPRPAPQIY